MPLDPSHDPGAGVPASVGEMLRAAREAAGRSVEQVSERTRVRATLLRDLEADRFSSSGAPVYVRGHLRAIAAAVGVDPAPIVARFDAQNAVPAPLPVAVTAPAPVGRPGSGSVLGAQAVRSRERTGPRWGLAVAGALGVLIVVLGIGLVQGPAAPRSQTVQGLGGPTPAPSAAPTPSPTASTRAVAPGLLANRPPVVGAQLRVRVIGGQSWVSVRNASGTLFEGVLHDGDFKDFADQLRLRVIVGNASAVDLNCGGRDSGPAGASGAVLRFLCTATGLTPA